MPLVPEDRTDHLMDGQAREDYDAETIDLLGEPSEDEETEPKVSVGGGGTVSGARIGTTDRGSSSDEEYKSKSGGRAFGADPVVPNRGASAGIGNGASQGSGTSRGKRGETRSERQSRRSRMLAYVARTGMREPDDSEAGRGTSELSDLIDAAAIKAALKYEEKRGWTPEDQPHDNPGYDIVSRSPDGERRLIEVKGIEGEWTDRGIKLSHVQYGMAENHPDEFWIYIVENARDLERHQVSAIANPFEKVEEYWFDQNWREIREEMANARELNVRVGAKVKHQLWKEGIITKVDRRGVALSVTVDFGFEGVKLIPYNSNLQIID